MDLIPADLSPGDQRSAALDLKRLRVHRIAHPDDPLFPIAYNALWTEFGPKNEMEEERIIRRRLTYDPHTPISEFSFAYDLLALFLDGHLAGIHDQTAIANPAEVVVHLSHILVLPASRRTGVAGWLRALPLQTARRTIAAAGYPATSPITLVGETEPADATREDRTVRLRAYAQAGYKKIDPVRVHYLQPDFRPPHIIDATGGPQLLPLDLLIRRVGHEDEETITGHAARHLVECLYTLYQREFRPQDMTAAWATLNTYPNPQEQIHLLPPLDQFPQ